MWYYINISKIIDFVLKKTLKIQYRTIWLYKKKREKKYIPVRVSWYLKFIIRITKEQGRNSCISSFFLHNTIQEIVRTGLVFEKEGQKSWFTTFLNLVYILLFRVRVQCICWTQFSSDVVVAIGRVRSTSPKVFTSNHYNTVFDKKK